MRIMQIVSGMGVNGAVLQCRALSLALGERGHAVTLVCRPGSWSSCQPPAAGLRTVTCELRRWPLGDLRRVAALARDSRAELVHTHQSRAHLFGVLLRCLTGIPCVATAHARHFQPHWRFNDFVIANSQATYRYHRRWNLVPGRRIQVVHYLLDPERFSEPRQVERQRMRDAWNVGPQGLVAGIIGEVIPRKGHLYAVRAWPEVAAALPRAKLVFVGHASDERYRQRVCGEARRLAIADRIVWAGYQSDIPAVMQALDVCVSAAVEEPLGLTIPEAMASSRAVVATRVGGAPENVVPDETGLLVPPANPRQLAAALTDILTRDAWRQACGLRGRDFVRRKYNPHRQLLQLESIYGVVAG
jgi:glycosyltransferase involved in cell wall biosynthesis